MIAVESWRGPLRALLREVAEAHGFEIDHLRGLNKTKRMVAARHDFCRRAYAEGRWSTVQIGRAINRDHTTVLYAVGALAKSRRPDTEVQAIPKTA